MGQGAPGAMCGIRSDRCKVKRVPQTPTSPGWQQRRFASLGCTVESGKKFTFREVDRVELVETFVGNPVRAVDEAALGRLRAAIAAEDVESWRGRLESEGVAVESVVTWPRGAKSLYFRDPDGNLAELITPGFWSIY